MSNPNLAPTASYLRHRAARGRRIAKVVHNRAIAVMLEDLARYLDLEAVVADTMADPFVRPGLAAGLQ
jgi:hypothetical protein